MCQLNNKLRGKLVHPFILKVSCGKPSFAFCKYRITILITA